MFLLRNLSYQNEFGAVANKYEDTSIENEKYFLLCWNKN